MKGAVKVAKSDEKWVKVTLFKDDNEFRDDVIASVNGRTYTIKRGVEVEVPECIAEVLHHADEQRNRAMDAMIAAQEKSAAALR